MDDTILTLLSSTVTTSWRIFAPNGLAPTFRLPTLPAAFAGFDFRPNAQVSVHLRNIDIVGMTADEMMARDEFQETQYGWTDQTRRIATARSW